MTSRPVIAGFLLSATSGMLSGCAAEVGDEGTRGADTIAANTSGADKEQVGNVKQASSADCGAPVTDCSDCDGRFQTCTTFTPEPSCTWVYVPYFNFYFPRCECVTRLSTQTVSCGIAGGGDEGGQGGSCDQYGHC